MSISGNMCYRAKYRLHSERRVFFLEGKSFPDGNPSQYMVPRIEEKGDFLEVSVHQPGLDPEIGEHEEKLKGICSKAVTDAKYQLI